MLYINLVICFHHFMSSTPATLTEPVFSSLQKRGTLSNYCAWVLFYFLTLACLLVICIALFLQVFGRFSHPVGKFRRQGFPYILGLCTILQCPRMISCRRDSEWRRPYCLVGILMSSEPHPLSFSSYTV